MKSFLRRLLARRLTNQRLLSHLIRQELHPERLVATLTAGLTAGVLMVVYSISVAALVFSGPLAPFISVGVGLVFLTAIVVTLVVTFSNSLPGIVTDPQDVPAIILAIMASEIAAQFPNNVAASLPTVMMAIALTTCITGGAYLLLGVLELGNIVRFIPYPVIGGFLAGTGYLLSQGAFNVMTGQFLSWSQIPALLQPNLLMLWLPGLGVAIALLICLRRNHSPFIMPGIFASFTALFYLFILLSGTSIAEAQATGLLLDNFPAGGLWQPLHWSMVNEINWHLILEQSGNIATTVLLSVISLLLVVSGIELATKQEIDLNQELRATGVANLIVGLAGGTVGFHALSFSTLSCVRIGAKSRLVGGLVSLVCLLTLVFNNALITLLPKAILGGVLLYLGFSFLIEWVYDAWFKLPTADYGIVILILLMIATVGFLPGVGVGLVVAIALFVLKSCRVEIAKRPFSGEAYQSRASRSLSQSQRLRVDGDRIHVLELQGFLFFGTTHALLDCIQARLSATELSPLKYVVLNFKAVNGIDSSAVLSLVKVKQRLQQQAVNLVLTQMSSHVSAQLSRGGVLRADDPMCQFFPSLDRGLEWCENKILGTLPLEQVEPLSLVLQVRKLLSHSDYATKFVTYLERWDVEAGENIFQQNQTTDAAYLIESGEVSVYFEEHPGQSSRMQMLGAGSLVGELDFLRNTPYHNSARADSHSTLYRLSGDRFYQMQQEQPAIAAAFQSAVLRVLGDRLTNAYKEIADLLRA